MSVYKTLGPSESEGGFGHKFKAGTTTTFHIIGEPLVVTQQFENDEFPKRRYFFPALLLNDEDEPQGVVCFAGGATIWDPILALSQNKKWGDPTKYSINISATGEKLDRKYTVMPDGKREFTEEDRKLVAKHKNSLAKYFDGISQSENTMEILNNYSIVADDPFAE